MVNSIEQIGAVLGLAAFVGLAVLVLLYFQQARDVRRLREWAGKAPERAAVRQDTTVGEAQPRADAPKSSRLSGFGDRVAGAGEAFAERWRAADRRSPIDLRILATLAVLAIAAGAVLTGGFGVLGSEEPTGQRGASERGKPPLPEPSEIEVAVLNGTTTGFEPGVPGLAGEAGRRVSEAGFQLGAVGDTESPFVTSVVMHDSGGRAGAKVLVREMRSELGELDVERMSEEVQTLSEGADVALVVGQDNADL